MQFFHQAQLEYVLLGLFGAAIIVFIIAFAMGSFRGVRRDGPVEELPDGLSEGTGPVPTFLIVLFVAFLVWGFIYTIVVAYWGPDF